ncbi:MORN repeat variant [Anatilimnocola aggregata]|uniref:MORN repeat variant n=1 Tax=Anatilimnocola aggregata TaxID=2528021 RepID=A0A517YK11_9BACT|nr:toxin-antitoxin system YwqK family antitoxin [Anatilimnocola aggregata]QDU30553.1 MORN repeat variant [Anatilimnocola aggregata]
MSSESKPTKRPWYRRIRLWQFSLRTLLLLMGVVSVACWYWLRPEQLEEKLASGELILRREYRQNGFETEPFLSGQYNVPTPNPQPAPKPKLANVGYWQLRSFAGDPVVSGQYRKGKQHGAWTSYYPNGRVATQGTMREGMRLGVWKTWSQSGKLLSEVKYEAAANLQPRFEVSRHPPVAAYRQSGLQVGLVYLVETKLPVSFLQGEARTWHDNGRRKTAGNYANNQKVGEWTTWNEQGKLIARGEYRRGIQEGIWEVLDPETNQLARVEFVRGLRKSQAEEQGRLLAKRLEQTTNRDKQLKCLELAAQFGPVALPLLEKFVDRDDPQVQFTAIMSCTSCAEDAAPWKEQLIKLAENSDPEFAAEVRWSMFQVFPDQRQSLLPVILHDIELAATTDWQAALEQVKSLYVAMPADRAETFALFLKIAADHEAEWFSDSWAHFVMAEFRPFVCCWGMAQPASTASAVRWPGDLTPHLKTALEQGDPNVRLAAVWVLHILIRDAAMQLPLAPGAQPPANPRFKIPEQLVPLVERARQDADPKVAERAAEVDAAVTFMRQGIGPGGWGGGGGVF